jgi:hypothetical protein
MPKVKISEYSATAADNTDINGIDIAEGCAPSGINDAIRTLMKQIKDLQAGTSGDTIPLTAGGTGATTASAARTALGATTTGNSLFTAVDAAAGRTALGVSLGVDVQAYDQNLTTFVSVFTLPTADGTANQVLATNGSGTLSFATGATGDVTTTGTQELTNKTLTNPTVKNYVESVVAIGTVTSSNTIALTNGTVQTATLTASTACTFTMPTATAGKSFVLLLKQAASTGNGTATFTSVKWGTAGAPTITATAGKMDILTFVADGTNWYGSIAQGYTP